MLPPSKGVCDTTILVSGIDICMVNCITTLGRNKKKKTTTIVHYYIIYTLLVRRRSLHVLAAGESTLTRELGTPIIYLPIYIHMRCSVYICILYGIIKIRHRIIIPAMLPIDIGTLKCTFNYRTRLRRVLAYRSEIARIGEKKNSKP